MTLEKQPTSATHTAKKGINVGLREFLTKQRAMAIVIVAALVALAVWTIMQQAHSGPPNPNTSYYSVDDGQSWFTDDAAKSPPFDHGGKEAVQAHVFDCDGDRFVGYLSRYPADAKAIIEKTRVLAKQDPNHPPATIAENNRALYDIEFKAPGDKGWTKTVPKLTRKCKDGSAPFEVMPWGPLDPRRE